jgi:hypothetical protein
MGKASLTDFAEDHPRIRSGYRAWIESIPEWPEVLAGWNAGITQVQIRRWLVDECGYDSLVASRSRIAHLSKKYPRIGTG